MPEDNSITRKCNRRHCIVHGFNPAFTPAIVKTEFRRIVESNFTPVEIIELMRQAQHGDR